MLSKNLIFLASAGLAVAVNMHRHGHEQLHKKDLKIQTDYEVVTDWVTVTVYDPPAPTSVQSVQTVQQVAAAPSNSARRSRKHSKASSSSALTTSVPVPTSVVAAEATPSTTAIPTPETTLITSVKPTEAEKVPTSVDVPAPTTEAPAAPVATEQAPAPAAPTPTVVEAPAVEPSTQAVASATSTAAPAVSSSGKKRGLAYNDTNLLKGFLGGDSKVSWAYGWNQVQDFDSSLGIEFVPMLWGPRPDHLPTWADNAKKAIAAGSTALLSFNEPDNAGQADITPAVAAAAHIEHMNPFSGQARISTPAITNSGAPGEGISWLKEFLDVCAGKCAVDFAAVHWYSNNGDDFLQHLKDVHDAVGLPVWVTEFAPIGNDLDYNQFLATVVHELDTNPLYDFVERYSYFMVAEGSLTQGGSPNNLGKTFAFNS